jgi:Zinc finger protein
MSIYHSSWLPIDTLVRQMRTWKRTIGEVPELVKAHYLNDPYYPRARASDPLYAFFKKGYLSAYPEHGEDVKTGTAFLTQIEAEQAKRDEQQAKRDSEGQK